jgi:hypothetical protein
MGMNLHMLTVLGLALNGTGSFMLIFCPAPIPPREIMEDGREKHARTFVPELFPEKSLLKGKWRYYRRVYGFRAGVGLLFLGFLLQFIAELIR